MGIADNKATGITSDLILQSYSTVISIGCNVCRASGRVNHITTSHVSSQIKDHGAFVEDWAISENQYILWGFSFEFECHVFFVSPYSFYNPANMPG
ncbi:putative lipoprotein [Klebsiella sp. AS10]|nr:putative lipoprotein [Klebsiella sp. AS10]